MILIIVKQACYNHFIDEENWGSERVSGTPQLPQPEVTKPQLIDTSVLKIHRTDKYQIQVSSYH